MHCCDMARAGQTLPMQLPDEWLHAPVERTDLASKSDGNATTYAQLNQQLKETIAASDESKGGMPSDEMTEAERKSAQITYEDKRLKNYEVRRTNDAVLRSLIALLPRREIENWNVVGKCYANRKNAIRRNAKNEVSLPLERHSNECSSMGLAVLLRVAACTGLIVRISFRTEA